MCFSKYYWQSDWNIAQTLFFVHSCLSKSTLSAANTLRFPSDSNKIDPSCCSTVTFSMVKTSTINGHQWFGGARTTGRGSWGLDAHCFVFSLRARGVPAQKHGVHVWLAGPGGPWAKLTKHCPMLWYVVVFPNVGGPAAKLANVTLFPWCSGISDPL